MTCFRPQAWGALVLLLLPALAGAQNLSELNPEISFVADTRARMADATEDDLELSFDTLEVYAAGYLSPFARGDVFVGIHEGELHVEEAYVSFTALPGGLGLRIGRFLADIGRFNPQHPHVYSFLDPPRFVRDYFGEEGYGDVGLNPSLLLDVGGVPVTLSGSLLSGELELEHAHAHAEADTTGEPEPARQIGDLSYNGRLSAFFTLGDFTHLEVGGTAGTLVHDLHEDLRRSWFGGDLKLRWRPHRRTSLTLAGELLALESDVEDPVSETIGSERALGAFGYVDLQFRRHWNVGALVDYAQMPDAADRSRLGLGAFLGYSLFEESTVLRALVRHDDLPEGEDDETHVQLQVVFSLGPHKPHQF